VKLLSWLVYVPLQIATLPLAIVGAATVAYRQLVVSQRLGVSQTAIEILNGRWTLHVFGLRDDPGVARLAPALRNTSTWGLWLALFPLWVKAKIAGEPGIYPRLVPHDRAGIAEMVPSRTAAFDEVIARRLGEVEQFVILGAGMDTRAYGTLGLDRVDVFELDRAETQRLKRETLERAGVDTRHVTFVSVDFATEDPFEKLTAHGYDRRKQTLFLWEGVTLYLTERSVRETLGRVKANAAPGSTLVVDIYGERMLALARRRGAERTLAMTAEGLQFGLSFADDWDAELAAFVESAAYRQRETHFMGTRHDKGPFMVVVALQV